MEKAQYGLDLPSSQKFQQAHLSQHENILAFQTEVDKVQHFQVDSLSNKRSSQLKPTRAKFTFSMELGIVWSPISA